MCDPELATMMMMMIMIIKKVWLSYIELVTYFKCVELRQKKIFFCFLLLYLFAAIINDDNDNNNIRLQQYEWIQIETNKQKINLKFAAPVQWSPKLNVANFIQFILVYVFV